jgi:hypothetical protein
VITARRTSFAVVAAASVLAVGHLGTARAEADPPQPSKDRDHWTAAAEAHHPGVVDAAVRSIATIGASSFESSLKRAMQAKDVARLARGLVLHTDAALLDRGRPEDAGSARFVVVTDGRLVGAGDRSPQWTYATQIAIALGRMGAWVPGEPARSTPAQRISALWFRTVAAACQQNGQLALAEDTIAWGVHLFPEDPHLLLARATLHQAYADRRLQTFFARARTGPGRGLAPDLTKGARDRPAQPRPPQDSATELSLAEADLRRALALQPALREARVRLAHVLNDRGANEEAASLARAALDAGLPPFFEMYATLILGRSSARLGRVDEAHAAYARAAALAPDAQAPRIGLAQVALVQGKPEAALSALAALAVPDAPAAPADEEWLGYFRVHDPGPQTLFRELWRLLP